MPLRAPRLAHGEAEKIVGLGAVICDGPSLSGGGDSALDVAERFLPPVREVAVVVVVPVWRIGEDEINRTVGQQRQDLAAVAVIERGAGLGVVGRGQAHSAVLIRR